MTDQKSVENLIKELPPELRQEVEDFVRFLLEKRGREHWSKPKFEWAGALKDLQTRYTSVELQHKIAQWRSAEQ